MLLNSAVKNLTSSWTFKMTNNACLRRLRYILDMDDSAMINIFSQAEQAITREAICNMLKKDEDPELEECTDRLFTSFLDGLIIKKRGKNDKKEDFTPKLQMQLTNNIIFKKLRIAFDLKAEDILSILSLADCQISKHELSAFFRKPKTRKFRQCKDQILRNFLSGLQITHRTNDKLTDANNESITATET